MTPGSAELKVAGPRDPVAVFPKASLAMMVREPATPAVTGDGKPVTINVAAEPGSTVSVYTTLVEKPRAPVAVAVKVVIVAAVVLPLKTPLLDRTKPAGSVPL